MTSVAHIVYVDGTEEQFEITAGPGIVKYLARKMDEDGHLSLFNNDESVIIPVDRIKKVVIKRKQDN